MKRSRLRRVIGKIALVLLVAVVSVITFFPFYWILLMSLQPSELVFAYPPVFLPARLSLANYVRVFAAQPVERWLLNTIIVSIVATAACLLISFLGSYSLSRFRYQGRAAVSFLLLISQMVPITLLMVPMFLIFRELNLLDKLSGMTIGCTAITMPICVWMLKEYFDTVPYEIEEAAIVDGCSEVGALFRVVLPISLPGIAATAGYAMVQIWNEYGLGMILLNSDTRRVLAVGLATFLGSEHGTTYELIAAASMVMIVPELILFILLQRYLIQGLAAGSVKG